jgi:hypothetical protein
VRGHSEARSKLDAPGARPAGGIFAVASEAEIVADFAKQSLIASPVGLVAALASEPVDGSMGDSTDSAGMIFVARQADATGRGLQETLLTGCVRRVAVDALRHFERVVRMRSISDLVFQIGVAGIAQRRASAGHELVRRSSVATGTGVRERWMHRTGREQRPRRGPVRVVAFDARDCRHLSAEMGLSQPFVRFVTHQAELGHRFGELKRLVTPMGVVARCTILRGCRVRATARDQFLNLAVAREAQAGPCRREESFLTRHVRLMTIDAASVSDRRVHRAPFELRFELGVTGEAEA